MYNRYIYKYYITKHTHIYVQCHAYHIMSDMFKVTYYTICILYTHIYIYINPSINWAKATGFV